MPAGFEDTALREASLKKKKKKSAVFYAEIQECNEVTAGSLWKGREHRAPEWER